MLLGSGIGVVLVWVLLWIPLWYLMSYRHLLMMANPFLRQIFDFSLDIHISKNEEGWECLFLMVPMWM